MKNARFYICPHCGNLVEMVDDAGVALVCCGQKMDKLVANSADASAEKHVPEVSLGEGYVEVNVGSVDHPMQDVHWIEWVELISDRGVQRKLLKPGEAPKVRFLLSNEKPLSVYAYCNLHGLWKRDLSEMA